jgi:hypothetical protein
MSGKKLYLQCCPNCNHWHELDTSGYYVCGCGAETFTSEWILAHPDHPAYQKYLEYLEQNKEEENNG